MRKIDSSVENPLDDIILHFCDRLLPFFKWLGFTANRLTLVGAMFRLWSIWGLFRGDKISFFIGGAIGYVFDCLDGHFARTYKMVSVAGDVVDHVSDVLFQAAIVYYLIFESKTPYKGLIGASYVGLTALMLIHMGCQQRLVNVDQKSAESLNCFEKLCFSKDWIHVTKFFGSGSFVLYSLILGVLF